MEDEKRMAGSYEIIQAFRIGDREIVLGEDLKAKPEERYMCAYCQQNEIAALYNEVMVSDDYCEIVKLFADRLSEQAEKTRAEVLKPKFQGIDVNIQHHNVQGSFVFVFRRVLEMPHLSHHIV